MFSIIDDNVYYLQVAFEANPLGIALLDSKSRFLHVNPAFCQMLGYTSDEFNQFTIQDITHPLDRQPSEWLTASSGSEEIKPHWYEKRYITKDGRIIWVSIMARVLNDSFGKMHLGMVIVEDITQSKLQEEQLRQSEQRFQSLVEAIPDMIILARKDGWIIDIKPAPEVKTWLNPLQYVHRYYSELPLPKELQVRVMSAFNKAFEQRQPQQVEYQLIFPDGIRDYEARLVAMNDEQGFAIVRDVTERKKMERELKHRDVLLEAINEVATLLLNPNDWDQAMQEVLRRLVQTLEVRRGRLFKHNTSKSGSYATLLVEWTQPQLSSHAQQHPSHKYGYQTFASSTSPQTIQVLDTLLKKECVKSLWVDLEINPHQALPENEPLSIILIPIFIQANFWGMISFDAYDSKRTWTKTEEEVLHIAADIIGVAIQRKHTEEALQYSEELYRGVISTSPDAILYTDLEGNIILANQQAANLIGFQKSKELIGKNLSDMMSHTERDQFLQHLLSSAADEPVRNYECLLTRQPGLRFPAEFSAMNIKNKQGNTNGIIMIFRDITERKMTESAVATTVEQLRSYVEILKQRSTTLTQVNELISKLQNCDTLEEIFAACEEAFNRIFPNQGGVLYHLSRASRKYEICAKWGSSHHHPPLLPAKNCPAIHRCQTILTSDDYQKNPCPFGDNPPYICMPLRNGKEVLGVFYMQGISDRPSEAWKLQVINTIVENLSLTIINLSLRERLHYQSTHDTLTGLYNRVYLEEAFKHEINRARRYQRPLCLLLIDLDDFKTTNDLYGHKAGDAILKEFGQFLLSRVRSIDIACRYGSDEFVIIMPETTALDGKRRAEELLNAARTFTFRTKETQLEGISLSISIAAFPQHGDSLESLIKAADTALIFSKKQNQGKVSIAGEEEAHF